MRGLNIPLQSINCAIHGQNGRVGAKVNVGAYTYVDTVQSLDNRHNCKSVFVFVRSVCARASTVSKESAINVAFDEHIGMDAYGLQSDMRIMVFCLTSGKQKSKGILY